MQPPDVYNRAFDATTASLSSWIETIKDVADVEQEHAAGYWRVRIRPQQPNTCAAELMLSRDQMFDLDLGSESLVAQPVTDFSLFQQVLEAAAQGHAVCRTWSASATGCALTREIIVHLADGREWSMRRLVFAGTAATELSAVASDRIFVAYRRA